MVWSVFGVFGCIVGGIFGSLDLEIFFCIVFGENQVCNFFLLFNFLVKVLLI